MTHLHHLTLQTGHSRRSVRDEIDQKALDTTGDLLGLALLGEHVRLPIDDDDAIYTLTASARGRCLTAAVLCDGDRLITFGVATHTRCGAGLWRTLVISPDDRLGDPNKQPQPPWCAVRLEDGITANPSAAMRAAIWLGDLERCIAWAWIDRLNQPREDVRQ